VIPPQMAEQRAPPTAMWSNYQVNRRVIAVMRQRLAAGEELVPMDQEAGLAWLERQAEVAVDVVAERQAPPHHYSG
jgi:hypothetical protein